MVVQIILQLFIKFVTWPFKVVFSKKGAGGIAGFMAYWLLSGMVGVVVWLVYGFEAYLTFNKWWIRITVVGLGLIAIATVVTKTVETYRWLSQAAATTGREEFTPGLLDLRGRLADADVPVASMFARNPEGAAMPVLDDETSTIVLGQTGTGKSTFVKSRALEWDYDGAVIAHALSGPADDNEFETFFDRTGADVEVVSTQQSDVRWDPFLDSEESLREMEKIASGIFEAQDDAVTTGWSDPAKNLLIAALVVTNAREGDFAHLRETLERGPEWIVGEVQKVPRAGLVAEPLSTMDDSELSATYTTLLSHVRPLLHSDLFDVDLPSFSLEAYFETPGDTVLVLDNIREDRHARGFWRYFLQNAIDLGFGTPGRQRFLVDEVDKLPAIENLDELVSAGRSAGVTGIVVAQDAHQLEDRYGDMANSIYVNCPNRVTFRAGDEDTAELALSSIGEVELEQRKVSDDTEFGYDDERQSVQMDEGLPLVTGDLTSLDVGEALIQSPHGWWLAGLAEPDLEPDDDDDDDDEEMAVEDPDEDDAIPGVGPSRFRWTGLKSWVNAGIDRLPSVRPLTDDVQDDDPVEQPTAGMAGGGAAASVEIDNQEDTDGA